MAEIFKVASLPGEPGRFYVVETCGPDSLEFSSHGGEDSAEVLTRAEVRELRDALTRWLGDYHVPSSSFLRALENLRPRLEYQDGDGLLIPVPRTWTPKNISDFCEAARLVFADTGLIISVVPETAAGGYVQVIGKEQGDWVERSLDTVDPGDDES